MKMLSASRNTRTATTLGKAASCSRKRVRDSFPLCVCEYVNVCQCIGLFEHVCVLGGVSVFELNF